MKSNPLDNTYTYKFYKQLARDFRRVSLAFDIVYIIVTIVYPIFAIFMEFGNFYINLIILILTVIYATLLLIFRSKKKYHIGRIYTWIRVILGAIVLIINVYSIYIATTNINVIAIILATLMTIFWIFKVVINILYELIAPRINILLLCLKQDAKPYAKVANQVTTLLKLGPVFNEEDDSDISKELVKVVEKDKKIEEDLQQKAIFKEIKLIDKSIDDVDGIVHIPDLISLLLSLDSVIVNKTKFIYQEYSGKLSSKNIKKLLASNPMKLNITQEELNKQCEELLIAYQDHVKNFLKYIDDDHVDYKNDKEFKKMLMAFTPIIIAMQKIIYLYGYEQIEDPFDLSKRHFDALMLALSIVLNDENKDQALNELYKASNSFKSKLMDFFDKAFFKRNKDNKDKKENNNDTDIPEQESNIDDKLVKNIEDKYFNGKMGYVLNNSQIKDDEK